MASGELMRKWRQSGAWLAPAVALMSRLKYPQKFLLISLLFVLPLGLSVYFVLSESGIGIEFAQKERVGLRCLGPLRRLVEHTAEIEAHLARELEGGARDRRGRDVLREATRRGEAIRAEVTAELERDKELSGALEQWRAFEQADERLRADASAMQLSDRRAAAAKQTAAVLALARHVGDSSNLILDPDLDSYYIMVELVRGLPSLSDRLNKARILGIEARAMSAAPSTDVERRVIALASELEELLGELRRGMAVAFDNNAVVRAKLDHRESEAEAAVERAIQALQSAPGERRGQAAPGSIEPAEAARGAVFALYDDALPELDGLLRARILGFERKRLFFAVILAATLGLVLYLFLGFYRAVMRTVLALSEASDRMAGGEAHSDIAPLAKDELEIVVNSFNSVATRLRTELEQSQKSQADLVVARDAAERANAAKSNFLAMISHELRTPLNGILGYGEMLLEDAKESGNKVLAADLTKITDAGRHLLDLINDLLDLSSIEAGKMEIHLATFDPGDVVREAAAAAGPLITKNKNRLTVTCEADVGRMRSAPARLRQALLCLLSNAAKFTQNGEVWVSARAASEGGEEWVYFSVRDTGIGLTPEQIEMLFQSFTQVDGSRTRRFEGAGMGLVICRRICNLLGGDVSVTSELGRGSTFTIRVPREAPSEDASLRLGRAA